MTPRDRQPDKPEPRALGDLLGDPDWLAEQDRRRREQQAEQERVDAEGAERRAKWAADEPELLTVLEDLAKRKRRTVDELLEMYRPIIGLARLTGENAATAVAQLENGTVSAKLLRGVVGLPHPKRGPETGRAEPERWRVVYELRRLGYAGQALDDAIANVAGCNVLPATYRRSASRFKGDQVAALEMDTPAIRKALKMPPRLASTGE